MAATTAKAAFIALIEHINAAKIQPADRTTMEAMRALSGVWTSSVHSLTTMQDAQNAMGRLDGFFDSRAGDARLRGLWGEYKAATVAYINWLVMQQQGC